MRSEESGKLAQVKERAKKLISRHEFLSEQLKDHQKEVDRLSVKYEAVRKSRAMIQAAAKMTQEQVQVHLSNMVTTALAAVFPNPYEFRVQFTERRGKVEADLLFVKNGQEMDPESSAGGGPLDVASFAFRMAFWSLGKSSPVLFLDEPFKFVSQDLHRACADMLRELAQKLGVQIVMISHIPGIIEAADRVFEIREGKVINT